MSAVATQWPTFPKKVSDAVLGAAADVFGNACRMDVTPRAAPPEEVPCAGIMGVISFFGDPVWSFAMVLPEATALAATAAFAGFDIPFDSPDMGDMVGEIANVIAGDIVARL